LKIYLTHCSAKKDTDLEYSSEEVTPDRMYTATPTKRFIKKCKEEHVSWAIFSDKYGVWFPNEKHRWYEKDPDTVTNQEYSLLVKDFERKLNGYSEIWFYHNPGRFHPLYKKLLEEANVKAKLVLFTHLTQIE
jgi:hypothetical protein